MHLPFYTCKTTCDTGLCIFFFHVSISGLKSQIISMSNLKILSLLGNIKPFLSYKNIEI